MIVEKIFRAFLNFTSEKYKHEHIENRVHVHDLLRCKHKSYLETMFPEVSSVLSPVLFLGEAVDEFVKLLVDKYKEELFPNLITTDGEYEKTILYNEKSFTIIGRPDIVLEDKIIEIKYSRTKNDKPLEHHINQLKTYMFLTQKKTGIIIYFTPAGIIEHKIDEEVSEDFVKELIDSWSSPRYDWECQYCVYRDICPYRVLQETEKETKETIEVEEEETEEKNEDKTLKN